MSRAFLALIACTACARADLVATFTRDGKSDTRIDRLPALSVPAGEPATPFLSPGPFEAVWKGKLVLDRRQRLAFSFEGEGAAKLKIDGAEILAREGTLVGEASKTTRLNPGEHEIEIAYSARADGSGSFRLFWEETGFPRQTVPPSTFRAEVTEAAILGMRQRAGRLVFARQNCVKCHVDTQGSGAAPMPETMETGPLLFGLGERVSEDWLRRWIADPHALKPATTMPALVDGKSEEGRQQSADLASYLLTLKLGPAAPAAGEPTLARDGGLVFHELGCVGCHDIPDTSTPDRARIPLNNVASKFLPGSLAAYLKKPDAYHPFARMPDFKLSDQEAVSLASYLTETSKGKDTKADGDFPAGDSTRGSRLAESLQCGACHPGLPASPAAKVDSLETILRKDWSTAGCAAPPDKRGNSPVLNLNNEDRADLILFSRTGGDSLRRDTSAEFARREIEGLRCTACHMIDDRAALLGKVHSESAPLTAHVPTLNERVDQSRPHLTFAGEMLYTSYIQSVLEGSASPRARPWLGMRMPAFRSRAGALASGLSRIHGVGPNNPSDFQADPALVGTGRNLVGAGGFGCVTCHGIGDQRPTAAFEVEGINFKLAPYRLREEFYHRWMDNPQSVTPGTKMPRYATGNQSQRADVLEGDAAKQYDAIWHYLHAK